MTNVKQLSVHETSQRAVSVSDEVSGFKDSKDTHRGSGKCVQGFAAQVTMDSSVTFVHPLTLPSPAGHQP